MSSPGRCVGRSRRGQAMPSYRIVIADSRRARNGAVIEVIGTYNPFPAPPAVEFNEERARYWLKVGAQPSEAVARMLRSRNLVEADKANERAH